MQNKQVRNAIAIVVAVTALSGVATKAMAGEWLDDWWGSKTESGGGYFKGQQRGYASGGQLNVRWGATTPTNVISAQPPHFKSGCGGVDAYMGSVAFLNPDMLVKKLQRILQNSAGVAFDMALQTLCPKCSEIMKSMEQLSNMLNGLALDDCKAATSLVNGVKSKAEQLSGSTLAEAKGVATVNGWFDGPISAMDDFTAAGKRTNSWLNGLGGKAEKTTYKIAGCPADWKKIFPEDDDKYPRSLLDASTSNTVGQSVYYPLLRGLVGDVVMVLDSAGDFFPVHIDPCAENKSVTYQDILNGNVWVRDVISVADGGTPDTWIGACRQMPIAGVGAMKTWAKNRNDNIKAAMVGKSILLAPEQEYIQIMPTAVHYALRMAVASDQYDTVSENLASIGATQYLIVSMNELFKKVGAARDLVASLEPKAGVAVKEDCDASGAMALMTPVVDAFYKEGAKHVAAINQTGIDAVTSFVMAMEQAQKFEASMRLVESSVGKTFGPAVAARLRAKLSRRG